MNTEALQAHYTSSRNGQMGAPGFQVRATTPGIADDELQELARIGAYKAPLDAPDHPSAEQIAADYPVALRWHRLPTGRMALVRSVYSGRDYSGRWGNFFAHSLLVTGQLPMGWPMDFFEWSGWQSALEPSADTDAPVDELDAIDLGEINPSESFEFDELSAFVRGVEGGVSLLARMIRAMFAKPSTERSLVIRSTENECLFWIACLQKTLPPSHAQSLTWSTYVYDPRRCADVSATCGETAFKFDTTERDYQFYVFDVLAGTHSSLPDCDGDYADVVAGWLANQPNKLAAFHEYVEGSGLRKLDSDKLLVAVRLFEATEYCDLPHDGSMLFAMVDFARQYTESHVSTELARLFVDVLADSDLLDSSQRADLVLFVVEVAVGSNDRELAARSVNSWSALAGRMLDGAEGAESIERARCILVEFDPTLERRLMETLLNAAHLRTASGRPISTSTDSLVLALHTVGRALHVVGGDLEADPAFGVYVETLVRHHGAVTSLRVVQQLAEGSASRWIGGVRVTARAIDDRSARVDAGRFLYIQLNACEPGIADRVRASLDAEPYYDILLGDWAAAIAAYDGDRLARLGEYLVRMADVAPDFVDARAGEIRSLMFESVPRHRRPSVAMVWLATDDARCHPELAAACLHWINEGLALADGVSQDELSRLETWRASFSVQLRPDRIALLRAIAVAAEADSLDGMDSLALRRALHGIHRDDFEAFLDRYLPATLCAARRGPGLQAVVYGLSSATHADLLRDKIQRFYARTDASSYDLAAAVDYWVVMGAPGGGEGHQETQGVVVDHLARRVAKQEPDCLRELEGRYGSLRRGSGQAGGPWHVFLQKVERRRVGVWGRLKRFFGRI